MSGSRNLTRLTQSGRQGPELQPRTLDGDIPHDINTDATIPPTTSPREPEDIRFAAVMEIPELSVAGELGQNGSFAFPRCQASLPVGIASERGARGLSEETGPEDGQAEKRKTKSRGFHFADMMGGIRFVGSNGCREPLIEQTSGEAGKYLYIIYLSL